MIDYQWDNTGIVILDVARFLTAVAALLLAVAWLRLGWQRYSGPYTVQSSILTYVSYAGAMVLIGAVRISRVGSPPTWDTWVAIAVVWIGVVGWLRRTRPEWRPSRILLRHRR